ncbi:MAG: radical SAM protein [Rikenellaceae bacterium]|nr:radical SAM protein [Rikenellaceae bacterium]MCL2692893.1 radical SAM protein [Rikenellaceae bacterium]
MERDSSEILLIFPPGWSTSSPYLSVPLLTAFLSGSDIPCCGIDLNIRILDEILTDKQIDRSAKVIEELLSRKDLGEEHRAELLLASDLYGIVKGAVDKTIERLRHGTISPREATRINRFIDTVYRIYSAPHYPGRIHEGALVYSTGSIHHNFLDYNSFEITPTLSDLERRVGESHNTNPFHTHLERFVADIDISETKLVGLSVCGYSQLTSSLCLARLLKERKPDLKIVMGGAIMPYLISALIENPFPFRYLDFIVSGSGERTLMQLYDYVCGKIEFGEVKGALYYDFERKAVAKNGEAADIDINSLFTPQFDPDELKLYLTPKEHLALPVLGSKGCYWGKCAFCGINCNYDGRFQRKRPALLVDDMERLTERYGINQFRLIDNCIHPNTLREISETIIARGNKFLWQCMVRFEEDFTPELWQQLYSSGLRVASFGLESPNQHLLDRMNKGVDAGRIHEILSQCRSAGIFTHCFFIVGFPGEENIHPNELIDFIRNNRYNINSLVITNFRLEGQSYVFGNQEEFGIEIARMYPRDYILPNYEHRDFCRAAERAAYVSDSIADLECSGICFSVLDDTFIIGNVFRDTRAELLSWQRHRIEGYRKLRKFIDSSDSMEQIDLSHIVPISYNQHYALFHNTSFFNYYVFKNVNDNSQLPLREYLNINSSYNIDYLFDILSGIFDS